MILFWREVTPHSFRAARGVGGTGIEPFLVSSVAGTRADRQEKGVVKVGLKANFRAHTEEKSFRSSP